jgi:mannose-1-phosphate guanylyltransferase
MQALILAGGEGTRLRPLTNTVPKSVLPLAGRPHIAYVIDWLVRHGVNDVVVSCGHLAGGIRRAIAELEPGVEIRYAEEPDARGTAGAIRFAEDMLGERFLVLNGDVLCDLDLTVLIEQHERTGARATIALYPVADPAGYGLVHRREDGEITEFVEKPTPDQIHTDEINAGAYLLERSVLERIPPDRAVSIEREVFPQLIGDGLFGIRLEGYWIDIGTPERYLEATWDLLAGRVASTLPPRDETGSLVYENCLLSGAHVGPQSVLGRHCSVGTDARVERSVLHDRVTVGADAAVVESVLGERVRVGERARVGPGAMVGAGAVIAPDTVLDAGARIEPGETASLA